MVPLLFSIYTTAPRLSAVVNLSPVVCTALAITYLYGSVRYTSLLTAFLGIESMYRPTSLLSTLTMVFTLGAVYEVFVELLATFFQTFNESLFWGGVLLLGSATGLGAYITVWGVQRELTKLRDGCLTDIANHTPDQSLVDRVARLAAQATVPAPDVRVRETDQVYAYTVGVRDRAIVVSSGLIEKLDEAELDAVLAHEICHIANRDVSVMSAALAPVVVAEDIHYGRGSISLKEKKLEAIFGAVLDTITGGLLWYGQLGAGVLSRGREHAADVAAAELTGNPAALASALKTLSEATQSPTTDLRDSEIAVQALNIIPSARKDNVSIATHPPTADRIAVLRALEREQERG